MRIRCLLGFHFWSPTESQQFEAGGIFYPWYVTHKAWHRCGRKSGRLVAAGGSRRLKRGELDEMLVVKTSPDDAHAEYTRGPLDVKDNGLWRYDRGLATRR